MAINVGINGFGRIGRLALRVILERGEAFNVVGINDLADADILSYLFKYDSTYRRYPGTVETDDAGLVVDGKSIPVSCEKDPTKLAWDKKGAEIVFECTGAFTTRDGCQKHIDAGAKKVILSAPPKSEIDATVVLGVNDDVLKPEHKIVSNASCTTNCLAPVAKVLHDAFGIKQGLMTTVHAYTNDQRILDMIHKKPSRARAAAVNIIPTTTGAAAAVGKVIPDLNGKLTGFALRVPVVTGSIVDLTAVLEKAADADAINAAMKKAAERDLKGILEYTEDPIVSSDLIGTTCSSLFDANQTLVIDDVVKVTSWYDNEWGFTNRMIDLAEKIAEL
jgi:glyceraldehyde 3-phosphate dehydrogenase